MPDKDKDGIDHINVYSKGKTELGRLLSNFAHTPFVTEEDGSFQSMEGYWYYILSGNDYLRSLYGYIAKVRGEGNYFLKNWKTFKGFKDKIRKGLRAKLEQNPDIVELLIESDLPLEHYYIFGNHVVEPTEFRWMIDMLESQRTLFKELHGKRFLVK